jgi:hypothetical protein
MVLAKMHPLATTDVMKKLLFLAWLFANILSCLAATKEEVLENEIARSKAMTNEDKVKHLMDMVEFRARYNVPRSQRELDLIQEAISEVIKTPGHAEFFAEEVRRKQKEVAHIRIGPYGERIDYNTLRIRYLFKTLPLMKSPETIKVLGEFLSDDKDLPEGAIPACYYANNGYAVMALKKIGLCNPAEKYPLDASAITIKMWQVWYEQVKAGEITFSFIGQPHEYRFQADGTWITIPLETEHDRKKSADFSHSPNDLSTPVTADQKIHTPDHLPTKKSRLFSISMAVLLVMIALIVQRIAKARSVNRPPPLDHEL